MEAFSLLKYWKGAGAGVGDARGGSGTLPVSAGCNGTATTTIVAAGDYDSDSNGGEDEGPFFDLEFAVPEEEARKLEGHDGEFGEVVDDDDEEDDDDGGEERELKLRPSSSTSSCDNTDSSMVPLSPSDEVLFKGQIVRIQGEEDDDQEISSKSGQIPIPVSLLRSATKLRVFMLKLKRSKSDPISTTTTTKSQPQKQIQQQQSNRKFFTVKFKVEEVPVISLLSRASSNSKPTTTTTTTSTSASASASEDENPATSASDSSEEKRNKKEVIQKYLKLVKPLYIRVSKRNQPPSPDTAAKTAEEVAATDKSEIKTKKVSSMSSVGLNLKGMSMSIMMAKKHLGKSKSAVVHSNLNANSSGMQKNEGSNRRDDSLLQQQDGIQGAILHCKRSFNSSTPDMEEEEELVLTRSASDPSHEKKRTTTATELTREKEGENDVAGV